MHSVLKQDVFALQNCMLKTENVFGLKAHHSGVARVKMDSAFPNWACRVFFSGLLEMTKQMEKHAGEMGNNRAGRGPRLPSTTMGSIISQLRGWFELRSFPFGSTGLHLLLRTLAPFLTSCHHQQFKTSHTVLGQMLDSFRHSCLQTGNRESQWALKCTFSSSLLPFKQFHFLN